MFSSSASLVGGSRSFSSGFNKIVRRSSRMVQNSFNKKSNKNVDRFEKSGQLKNISKERRQTYDKLIDKVKTAVSKNKENKGKDIKDEDLDNLKLSVTDARNSNSISTEEDVKDLQAVKTADSLLSEVNGKIDDAKADTSIDRQSLRKEIHKDLKSAMKILKTQKKHEAEMIKAEKKQHRALKRQAREDQKTARNQKKQQRLERRDSQKAERQKARAEKTNTLQKPTGSGTLGAAKKETKEAAATVEEAGAQVLQQAMGSENEGVGAAGAKGAKPAGNMQFVQSADGDVVMIQSSDPFVNSMDDTDEAKEKENDKKEKEKEVEERKEVVKEKKEAAKKANEKQAQEMKNQKQKEKEANSDIETSVSDSEEAGLKAELESDD